MRRPYRLITVISLISIYCGAQQSVPSIQQTEPFNNFQIGNFGALNYPLRLQIRIEDSIPSKYQGEDRSKILLLIQQLKNNCPECAQVEPIPSNPIFIEPFPNFSSQGESKPLPSNTQGYECSVPQWLKARQDRLVAYATSKGIELKNHTCDRDSFIDLIDAIN